MVRWAHVSIALASAYLLAACSSAQSVPQVRAGGVEATQGTAHVVSVIPDTDCKGVRGVEVTPCPVTLTNHTKRGVVVTVSGPGVVNSYVDTLNSCSHNRLCYNLQRERSSQTQWRITHGRDCGRADIEFDAVDSRGKEIGHAFLDVVNQYCP